MKTLKEIEDKIEDDLKNSVESMMISLSSGIHPLMYYVKKYLIEGAEPDILNRENVIDKMQNYINFAYEKAYDQRGISASRSMWKFSQWLWVLDDDEMDCENYDNYGIGVLDQIVSKYGLDTTQD